MTTTKVEVGKSYQYVGGGLSGAINKVIEINREQKLVKIIVTKGRDDLAAIQASENPSAILYEPGCKYTLDLSSYEPRLASGEIIEVA